MENVVSQHISKTPDVCGGKACIAGRRIRVMDVVALHEHRGYSPDEIVSMFEGLTLADVHAALAYYYDNQEAIDRATAADKRFAQSVRRKMGPGPLEEKRAAKAEANRRLTHGTIAYPTSKGH